MALQHGLFFLMPLMFTAYFLYISVKLGVFAFDFHYAYWPAGKHVLSGVTPYVDPHSPVIGQNIAFAYPAVAAVLFAPLSLIPSHAADVLFTAVNVGCLFGALRLLDVRDWRLYGLVLLWPPVIHAWQNANVTLLLLGGIAAVWRYRRAALISGALVALLVSVKLFVWPLAVWLLATRRYAALGYALAVGTALNVVAWSVIGFDQLDRFRHLLSALTHVEERRGYSIAALAMRYGASREAAYVLGLSIATGAILAAVALGRRGLDGAAMLLSIAAILLASPILWTHYFSLLIVPLALMRSRPGLLWAVPLAMFFCPETPPTAWRQVVALTVGAVIVTQLWRRPALSPKATSRSVPLSPLGWVRLLSASKGPCEPTPSTL